MNSLSNRVRHLSVFWTLLVASLVLIVAGHLVIHGQNYSLTGGPTFNPLTFYVSDYAAKWPEGLWIKAGIVCFCLAIAWFCDLAMRELAKRRWLLLGRLFWLIVTGVMIGGVLLVVLFDMLPDHYSEVQPGWFRRMLGAGPSHELVPRSPQEWSMRWYHNLGFHLFIRAFAAAAIVMVGVEAKRKAWAEVATSIFLLIATGLFSWWLSSGTQVPGVPQRTVLLLIAFWLVRSVYFLRTNTPTNTSPPKFLNDTENHPNQLIVFDAKRKRGNWFAGRIAIVLVVLGFLSVNLIFLLQAIATLGISWLLALGSHNLEI